MWVQVEQRRYELATLVLGAYIDPIRENLRLL